MTNGTGFMQHGKETAASVGKRYKKAKNRGKTVDRQAAFWLI